MWAALFLKVGQIGSSDASLATSLRFITSQKNEGLNCTAAGSLKPRRLVFGSHEGQKCAYEVFVVRPEIRGSLGDVSEDGRIN